MSVPRLGYGSEWHMLRFLGRHRAHLTNEVLAVTKGTALEWLDFGFTQGISRAHSYGDAEITGLEFLSATDPARLAWAQWWPQRGKMHHWDAVAKQTHNGTREWLLVEAKGNLAELASHCGAKASGGLNKIVSALGGTQAAMGIVPCDWTTPYYQYANRLAMLHFLTTQGIAARLLFIYFTGDAAKGRICPANQAGWTSALATMKSQLGLTGTSTLEARIHELYLPVV